MGTLIRFPAPKAPEVDPYPCVKCPVLFQCPGPCEKLAAAAEVLPPVRVLPVPPRKGA